MLWKSAVGLINQLPYKSTGLFFILLVCVKKQNQESNTHLKYAAEEQRCDNKTADKQQNVLLSTGEGLFMRQSLMEGKEVKMSASHHMKEKVAAGHKVLTWHSITPSCIFPPWVWIMENRVRDAAFYEDRKSLVCRTSLTKYSCAYCLKSCLVKAAPGEKMQREAAGVQPCCWGCGAPPWCM